MFKLTGWIGAFANIAGSLVIALNIKPLILPAYILFVLGAVAFVFHFTISNNRQLARVNSLFALVALWGAYNFSNGDYQALMVAMSIAILGFVTLKSAATKRVIAKEQKQAGARFSYKSKSILLFEKASVSLSLLGFIIFSLAIEGTEVFAFAAWLLAIPFSFQVASWIGSASMKANTVAYLLANTLGIYSYVGLVPAVSFFIVIVSVTVAASMAPYEKAAE